MRRIPYLVLPLCISLAACEADVEEPTVEDILLDEEEHLVATQGAWWANMIAHCGNAYGGGLVLEPEGDEMLDGDEQLIAHFVRCDEEVMHIAFHIERPREDRWDRSRTWIYSRTPDHIELRHDHRQEDGTPDEVTDYGGFTETKGTANRQEFRYEPRSTEEGILLGWRVEIEPGERYTYGTIRGDEWTWRVDFDLADTVAMPPPAWGHE